MHKLTHLELPLSLKFEDVLPRLWYHAETAVLFTIADMKTVFFPIVSGLFCRVNCIDVRLILVRLRVRDCPSAFCRSFRAWRSMDLDTPIYVQRLQPGARRGRRRGQQAMAPAALWPRYAVSG